MRAHVLSHDVAHNCIQPYDDTHTHCFDNHLQCDFIEKIRVSLWSSKHLLFDRYFRDTRKSAAYRWLSLVVCWCRKNENVDFGDSTKRKNARENSERASMLRSWKGCFVLRWFHRSVVQTISYPHRLNCQMANAYKRQRTISSERKCKECNVKNAQRRNLLRPLRYKNIQILRNPKQHVSWLTVDADTVSNNYQTKLAHREYRTKHQKKIGS